MKRFVLKLKRKETISFLLTNILNWAHKLSLTDTILWFRLFQVFLSVCVSAGAVKELSFRSGYFDKMSVCVYLLTPSSVHYHENGLSPLLISLCLCCNKCLHSHTGKRTDGNTQQWETYSWGRCSQTWQLPSMKKQQFIEQNCLISFSNKTTNLHFC